MMFRFIVQFISFLLLFESSHAQNDKSANVWYFGDDAGLDFNSGMAKVLDDGKMQQREGCSSICDEKGRLVLYTNGIQIWNGKHRAISTSSDLGGNNTSTQSAIIVSKPGTANIYYVFTTYNYLTCITVDISLNDGEGGIVSTQTLMTNSTEKLAAVKHCNKKDFWILAHEEGNNTFRSFLVTNSGVESSTENKVGSSFGSSGSTGYMKFSPDANMLCLANFGRKAFELYEFDNSTGIISNPMTLSHSDFNGAYGVEFSPDTHFLYVTGTLNPGKEIYQMDITDLDPVKIIDSRTLVGETSESYFGALQLGPDGKIYVAKDALSSLGVINNPNLKGLACQYDDYGVKLNSGNSRIGMPNIVATFIQSGRSVFGKNCDAKVFAPDIFTPNQDGINDKFKILIANGNPISLEIFNSWGICIYTDNKPEPEWDGKVNGEDCQIGTYVYVLKYRNERRSESVRRGTVILQK